MLKVAMLSKWHVHAEGYAQTILKTGKAEITAVWDEDESRGQEWFKQLGCKFYGDVDALLASPEVDAVVCCTPTTMHREIIIKAAKAKAYVPQGTYILWVDFSGYGFTPEKLNYLINRKANVAVQSGVPHDPEQGGQYIRICLTSPKAVVLEAIDRIARAFEEN